MKKNVMMRLASIMMVLVLMTSSVISGTFAKYVTSGTGSDKARVAKFGVAVTAEASMFADGYLKDDESYTLNAYSVYTSEDAEHVVAPGTKGDMANIVITGQPEVAVRVTYDVTKFELTNWVVGVDKEGNEAANTYYCPIAITVKQGANEKHFYGMNYASADAFKADVIKAIESYSKDYQANTNLATVAEDNLDISWSWAFENTGNGISFKNSDVQDTALGDAAANGTNIGIELALTCTVTQID